MNKKVSWSMAISLGVISPAALALGLGGASIESYLGQSLDIRVEVISQSSEELESITAGLASADDFELLGLSRTAITVPLEFELITSEAQPYIHITSDLDINEPVVQVLLEVVWANGRMLREYTLFLDPPTIDSTAPPVAVKPVSQPALEVIEQETPVPEVQGSVTDEPAQQEPEPVSEPELVEQTDEQDSSEEIYGPVANGETLWGIAREFSKGSGYTVNQAMLALQRKNPDAFMRGNINSLKRGAILRLPTFSEMAELTSREALLEAMRQEEMFATSRPPVTEFSTPTVADSGDYQETTAEQAPEPIIEEDPGHLELVPPRDDDQGEVLSEQLPQQGASTDDIEEDLSRTEEELLNAQQENSYLNQRIQELEAEVAAQSQKSIAVEDSELARIESNLAKERAADKVEPPLAITPGGESKAWYAGKTGLIGGIAVVLIALIIWGLRRRSAVQPEEEDTETVESITGEAEETLRTLDQNEGESDTVVPLKPKKEPEPEPMLEPEPEPVLEPEPEPVLEPEVKPVQETGPLPVEAFAEDDDDLEMDDPETKLDLARAYLSLGDKEASRSMLEEVMKSGSEAQKAEAQQMMDEI